MAKILNWYRGSIWLSNNLGVWSNSFISILLGCSFTNLKVLKLMPKSIPFKLIELEPESYHILVDATINGEPVKLIVDSGASRSVFDIIYDTGERVEGISDTVAVGFMSENVNIELASIPSLLVAGVKFNDFPIALVNLSSLRELYKNITGLSVAGLLGCDFLVHNVSSINLRSKKIFIKDLIRNR